MSQRVSRPVQAAVMASLSMASQLGHDQVVPAHLMTALLITEACQTSKYAPELSSSDALRLLVDIIPPGQSQGTPAFSDEMSQVMSAAAALAINTGALAVTEPVILSALLELDDADTLKVLEHAGVSFSDLRPALEPEPSQESTSTVPHKLTGFVVDLCATPRQDPHVSRPELTERLATVLSRRSKSNPVLVGPPGVGKTAIVEALADQILAGTAPADLGDFRIWQVDLGSLLAGTRTRGDFEDRVKELLSAAASRKVILFIDEIHALMDAGATSEAGTSAQDLLKPALSRPGLRLIGATTQDEFKKFVEKDAALVRRLTRIEVPEPAPDLARDMLAPWVSKLSEHHGVAYDAAAVDAAVSLSHKWISDRFLPDKALDVLDEAGSVQALARARGKQVEDISREHIARVVSDMTKIPLTSVDQSLAAGLLGLADQLNARVIGQTSAVDQVSRAVLRRRSGIGSVARPASFLFVGPTGVGKTELAKALAEVTLGDDAATDLIVVDCSELDSPQSVAKLIGAPPGYVGHGESADFIQRVRRNRNAVILFDEADKAHPRVFDLLLQVLEDGRLSDSEGTVVDFSGTTVILTSNHGAHGPAPVGFADTVSSRMVSAVKDAFRPEFLNRLDAVVEFLPLSPADAASIAALEVAKVVDLASQSGVRVMVDDGVYAHLAQVGFDPVYGARSLRRSVVDVITDPLADLLLSGSTEVAVTVCQGRVLLQDCTQQPQPVPAR